MGQNALPVLVKAITTTAAAATSQTANFKLGFAESYTFIINITAASGTSPTADFVVQTSVDKGTTWISLPLRSAQKTAAAISCIVFRCGLGENEVALENAIADTGGTLAKNCVFDPNHMRVKYTIGGTNPSFTFTIYGFANPNSI